MLHPVSATVAKEHEHVLPVRTYLAIYGALVAFTIVTVLVSVLELGTASLLVAMLVGLIKAALVVAYFMHLRFDTRFNAIVFLSSLLFLAIIFGLTMVDLGSRDSVVAEEGNDALRNETPSLPGVRPPVLSK